METILEVCVDSLQSAIEAKAGGADRIELCSNLIIGGTTPSITLFQMVKERINIPVHVLIRPRFGDFLYNDYEKEEMKRQVEAFCKLGADGIVIGALQENGDLDMEFLEELVGIIRGPHITLHRAFDMCRDPWMTLGQAEKLGISTILTSGQKSSCMEGIGLLSELQTRSEGRISIMAGGGIHGPEDVKKLYEEGIRSFHMSGKISCESGMEYRNPDITMGLNVASEYTLWKTDREKTGAVKKVLRECWN